MLKYPNRAQRTRQGTNMTFLKHSFVSIFYFKKTISKIYYTRGNYSYVKMEFRSVESLIWLFGENWHRQIFINESGDIYSDCKILFYSEEQVKYTITLLHIKFDNFQCKNKKEAEKEAFENHTTVSVESSKQSTIKKCQI